MLILPTTPPLAVIQFTVNRFVSVRQGTMMYSADPPKDVTSSLASNTSRVSMPDNNTFEFDVGVDPPVQLAFTVLPYADYAAVGLFVQKVSADPDGGGVWDRLTVGHGPNDNDIYVKKQGPAFRFAAQHLQDLHARSQEDSRRRLPAWRHRSDRPGLDQPLTATRATS